MPIQIYWKFHHQKLKISDKNSNIVFHISAQNIDCGYSFVCSFVLKKKQKKKKNKKKTKKTTTTTKKKKKKKKTKQKKKKKKKTSSEAAWLLLAFNIAWEFFFHSLRNSVENRHF